MKHVCTDCNAIINRYQSGLSSYTVAAEIGTSCWRVFKILRLHGVPIRRTGGPRKFPAWAEEARRRWNLGQTMRMIGDAVGVTAERVRQVLVRLGVDTQSHPPRSRRHKCGSACQVVLAALPPVSPTRLARESGVHFSRIARAIKVHKILTTHGRHVCNERCARMRTALETGLSVRRAALQAGFRATGTVYQRFPVYHPEWNWHSLRRLPAQALVLGEPYGAKR